jgi:hypothetical protein
MRRISQTPHARQTLKSDKYYTVPLLEIVPYCSAADDFREYCSQGPSAPDKDSTPESDGRVPATTLAALPGVVNQARSGAMLIALDEHA